MKKILAAILFLLLSSYSFSQNKSDWKLIYHNDKDGKTIDGKIDDLIEAVRLGEEIRIYWSAQRKSDATKKVEHFADAKFLTILSDTIVFAQIDPIIGQTPKYDEQTIELKENLEWSFIAASNGKSDTMMRNVVTGEILGHGLTALATKWYIKK
ncbi:hypothetical protein [Aquimarina mytili]|uniref:Uncharacterized protein n=1 Tax=Aquimarina mytili TaxID=874423 RepID=A0A937DA38_9FLAO|nr:hypothetical protein [Aquimarina mytili]MBL0685630.1 hypothetical protein [Aquimarina mytili]